MRIGIHYISWRLKDMRTTHNPQFVKGYWVVYPLPGDPAYKGLEAQPEQAIYEPLCFTDLLSRLFTEEQTGHKRRLVAWHRKTARRNVHHEWKTQLWRNKKGLVYGRVDQFGNRRVDWTSYSRPNPWRKIPGMPQMTEEIPEEELIGLYERSEGKKWLG